MADAATGPVHHLLVVGCGLIGGSVAAGATAAGWTVTVWDPDPAVGVAAVGQGIAVAAAPDLGTGVAGADTVLLAAPTLAVEQLLADLAALDLGGRTGLVVTDAASVKGSVVAAADAAFGGVPSWFVPGHPIAGSERSGVAAANPGLFRDHKVVLTPQAHTDPAALARVETLWRALGAVVQQMPVEDHDRVFALTSHLPHLLAFALVDCLAAEDDYAAIFSHTAGGFRDFTRIASSSPRMWHDIALANREALGDALDHLLGHLGRVRDEVAAGDGPALEAMMERARTARDTLLPGAGGPSRT